MGKQEDKAELKMGQRLIRGRRRASFSTYKREITVRLGLVVAKAMAPHPSTLAWKISWNEEPGRLQSMGSLRVGHD